MFSKETDQWIRDLAMPLSQVCAGLFSGSGHDHDGMVFPRGSVSRNKIFYRIVVVASPWFVSRNKICVVFVASTSTCV